MPARHVRIMFDGYIPAASLGITIILLSCGDIAHAPATTATPAVAAPARRRTSRHKIAATSRTRHDDGDERSSPPVRSGDMRLRGRHVADDDGHDRRRDRSLHQPVRRPRGRGRRRPRQGGQGGQKTRVHQPWPGQCAGREPT